VDLGIRGRTALLSGASRGLGKACAFALAREGADVTIVARTRDILERTGAEIAETTGVVPAATATGAKTLPARILGVIFAPKAAYADVAGRPRWLGALVVVLLLTGGSTFAFLSTDIGKNAMLDQQRQTMESFGVKLNDQAIQRMEEGAARAPYFGAIGQAVFLPVAALAIAGIALAVFNAVLDGDAKFKQVFAIVVHSGVILALGAVFVLPLDYARETLASPTTLSVFVPFLEENSFVARFLGFGNVFDVDGMVVSLNGKKSA
jgi:NAD(P)-dependent dehydrogenase (short-subunit alcohol dehydrogenase family)